MIIVDNTMQGAPHFAGTTIEVRDVWDEIDREKTYDDILAIFPQLVKKDIEDTVDFMTSDDD